MRIATPIYTISSTTSTIYSTNVNGTVVQVQEVQSAPPTLKYYPSTVVLRAHIHSSVRHHDKLGTRT